MEKMIINRKHGIAITGIPYCLYNTQRIFPSPPLQEFFYDVFIFFIVTLLGFLLIMSASIVPGRKKFFR